MIEIFDNADVTKQLILEQFKGNPYFEGLNAIQDTQYNELQAAAFQLMNEVWIETGEGVQLDRIGDIIGLPRFGRDDESYRKLLKIRASINTGSGEPELVIAAIAALYEATTVHYIPDYPAGVEIQHDGVSGLFTLDELVTIAGDPIETIGGDQLFIKAPDTGAIDILNDLVPSGVDLTVTQI